MRTPSMAPVPAINLNATRFQALDDQCLGKGKARFGYTIGGGTYEENVLASEPLGCEPFGSRKNNITNFFCCEAELKSTPKPASSAK